MFSKIFPEHRFLFYTERTHGGFTQQRIREKFEQIDIDLPKSPRNRMEWLEEIAWDIGMMKKIRKKKPEYIVCMGYTWEIVLFAKLFQRKQKIVFFFHSIEQEIKQRLPLGKPVWWFWRSLEWRVNAHVQIVFGESLLHQIAKIRPKLKFKSIDLPRLPCYDDTAPINTAVSPPGKFAALSPGITGNTSILLLLELEQKLRNIEMPENFELHYKGGVDSEGRLLGVKIPDGSKLRLQGDTKSLSSEELDAYINMMDFCVFLYPADYYLFTASGALLEALAHLKPFVALHNPYFDYVFDKMGDIGYLCDTVDEMAATIKEIVLAGDIERYNTQRQNIKEGLKLFSPEYLAVKMKSLLLELEQ
jgi:hypothetical protein